MVETLRAEPSEKVSLPTLACQKTRCVPPWGACIQHVISINACWMPDTTYVFELKVNGTAQEALDQINSHNYALPYQTEGRKVVKVGVAFDRETMTVGDS